MFIKLALAAFYLTRILLFEQKQSHFGPFPSSKKFVYDSETGHSQPVTLFDWVRRLTLNPYTIDGDIWVINPQAMDRWTCPMCLSFWICIPLTILSFIFLKERNLFKLAISHFALASVSAIVNYVVDYVQMQSEEEVDVPPASNKFFSNLSKLRNVSGGRE